MFFLRLVGRYSSQDCKFLHTSMHCLSKAVIPNPWAAAWYPAVGLLTRAAQREKNNSDYFFRQKLFFQQNASLHDLF